VPSTDADADLKPTDLTVLVGFALKPGVSPEYLAARLDMREGRVTRSIRRLFKADLLKPFTGNQNSYAPTDSGAGIARDWLSSHEEMELDPALPEAIKGRRHAFPRWRAHTEGS
jgi:DNA-binding MarR family transcriptional regulator